MSIVQRHYRIDPFGAYLARQAKKAGMTLAPGSRVPHSSPVPPPVCLVTGATSGIGFACAQALVRRGARVLLHGRSLQSAEAARQRILVDQPTARIDAVGADLRSLEEVRRLAADVSARFARLSVLVNNAGVERWERQVSADDFEETWAVNHLAPLLLSLSLLPALQPAGRIVNVSSLVHRFGRIDWEDLQMLRGYGAERAYYRSKLAALMAALELARRVDRRQVAVLALAPGLVRTNFGRDFRGFARFWSQRVGTLLFRKPSAVAEEICSLALDPAWAGQTGLYVSRGRVERPSARATDPLAQRRLWELSVRALGLDPEDLPASKLPAPARPGLRRWLGACAAGELLGFGAAALWAWLALLVFGPDPVSLRARLGVLGLMVLAGGCEGVVLGLLQSAALRAWFPKLRARRWVSATAAVAGLGWLLGMLPSTLGVGSAANAPAPEAATHWVLLGAAVFGSVAGALFGFAQWLVLRRYAYDARRWITANALGWGIGLPWSYLAGSVADVSESLSFALSCAVLAGTLMGLSVALVTGRALSRLEPRALPV